jgi:hypothetical protein
MELKNAVAVCLISLFSATLVVLIARSLDSQAASRIEPQLASIVQELQALRKQGGIATTQGSAKPESTAVADTLQDGLIVYYFHSNTRCPTCQAIETQSKESVQKHFASQLGRGEMAWKILNYEQPAVAPLTTKFDVQMPVVVLAKMKGGQIQDWRRLDEVWALVGDKPAFAKFIREQVEQMLSGAKPTAAATPKPSLPRPEIPMPVLPIPSSRPNIPLPK